VVVVMMMAMIMIMMVVMIMMMLVIMTLLVIMPVVMMMVIFSVIFSGDHHLHPRGLERPTLDLLRGQLECDAQPAEARGKVREREARVNQRPQRHVAAHPGEGIEVGDSRHTHSLETRRAPSSAQKTLRIKNLPVVLLAVPP